MQGLLNKLVKFRQAFATNALSEKTGIVMIEVEANDSFHWDTNSASFAVDQLEY